MDREKLPHQMELRYYEKTGQRVKNLCASFLFESRKHGYYLTDYDTVRKLEPKLRFVMYPTVMQNRQQLVDDLSREENRQQPVDDLEAIFQIPWGHLVQILAIIRHLDYT